MTRNIMSVKEEFCTNGWADLVKLEKKITKKILISSVFLFKTFFVGKC